MMSDDNYIRVSETPMIFIPTLLQCLMNSNKFKPVDEDVEKDVENNNDILSGFAGCSERAIYWEVNGGIVFGDTSEGEPGYGPIWYYCFFHGERWWQIGTVDITQLPEENS
jgi:hypothetical protein